MFADSKPSLHGNQARVWLFACSEERLYEEEKTDNCILLRVYSLGSGTMNGRKRNGKREEKGDGRKRGERKRRKR